MVVVFVCGGGGVVTADVVVSDVVVAVVVVDAAFAVAATAVRVGVSQQICINCGVRE